MAGVFLDCDSICVGQQARCVTAFLLLCAAEWATSNRYEWVSWEEMMFFHCPVFCDELLLLIQCATADRFRLFILFIVFFKKLFLDEEGLNHRIFLQVIGSLRIAVLVVFRCPVLLNVQDMPRGSSAPNPFIFMAFFSDFHKHLHDFIFIFFSDC